MGRKWVLSAALAATATAAAVVVAPSLATTCTGTTWANTSASGDWNTASNWSPATVPNSSTTVVCLPSGSYTVSITGASDSAASVTVGTGVTLDVIATASSGSLLSLNSGTSDNSGTLELSDNATTSSSQEARILLNSSANLTNDGTILSDPGGGGFGTRAIDAQSATGTLNNASGGTITVNQDLQINSAQAGLFETGGAVTIPTGKKLLVDPSGGLVTGSNPSKQSAEMDITGGTITDDGTFEQGFTQAGSIGGAAALKVTGGTITGAGLTSVAGNPTDIAGTGVGASFSGAGSGTYTFVGCGCANATTLGGTIGSSQTVALSASTTNGGVNFQVNSNLTNDGTIELTDSDTSGTSTNADNLDIAATDTLTNDGTIVSDPGPAGKGQRIFENSTQSGTLDNASTGTINVNQNLQVGPQGAGTFTTTGTVNAATGEGLQLFPNGGGTVNLNGGTVAGSGTMEIGINASGNPAGGAEFNINGGTVSGSPIIAAEATTNFSGAGSGSFRLEGAASIFSGGTITGTIAAGDNVSVSGTSGPSGSAVVTASGPVVNDGTFSLTDPDTGPSGSVFAELEIPGGSAFTNNATMTVDPGPAGSGYRSIDGTLNNAGTLNVNMLLQLGLHSNSQLENSGTVDVASGQTYQQGLMIMSSASLYTQSAGTTNLGGASAALTTSAMLLNGGSLTGAGTICGQGGSQAAPCGSGSGNTDLTSAGTIAPAPSPSTITVKGNYTQSAGGTLAVGVNASGNDQLSVTGTAGLDGTLQVSTASGFTPGAGTKYKILDAPGGVSGKFATTSGTGSYSVAYNPTNVQLTALAPSATVGFDPASVTFGSPSNTIAAGTTGTQTETITDTGTVPLQIGSLSITGPQASLFSLTSDGCSGQTLQAGASCKVTLDFKPAAAGTDTAALSVPDNAPNSPQQVPLTGYAGAAGARITLSAPSLSFGTVGVGQTGVQKLTVTSTGSSALNITSIALTGANSADYKLISDTCSGTSLAPGGTCVVFVTLTPTGAGARTAVLAFTDDAPGSPQGVTLSGTAITSAILSGKVFNGAATGHPPLAGATVELCTDQGSASTCREATTDASGSYSFSGLAPGAYRMEAMPAKQYLAPSAAVLRLVAGPNNQDFTLAPPQPIPAGVSVNGQTSGHAVSFWTNQDTIDVPLGPAPSGKPGLEGVTVVDFRASPAGSLPISLGILKVSYKFDSSGVPRLLSVTSSRSGDPNDVVGQWIASLAPPESSANLPSAVFLQQPDLRGWLAQGEFIPSRDALHGLLDISINHYSLFGQDALSLARDGAAPVAHTAQAGAAGDQTTQANGAPCVQLPTYAGGGRYNLPGGATWLAVDGNGVLFRSDGTTVGFDTPPFSPLTNITATSAGGDNYLVFSGLTGSLGTDTNSSGENGPADVIVPRGGGSFLDEAPGDQPGRFEFHADGSLVDTLTGTTYGASGNIRVQGQLPPGTVPCPPAPPPGGGSPPPPPPVTIESQPPPDSPHVWAWVLAFGLYKDPSGTVISTSHVPVAGAKVVLERAGSPASAFAPVPNGSTIMSPSNRRNPDHATALGQFGWDVLPGFYEVSAQHAGCSSPHGGKVTRTKGLAVPPAVLGLKLTLRCPHLRRTRTRTKIKGGRIAANEIMLVAAVRGRHPQGLVRFTRGGRTLGTVPLDPRNGRASLMVAGRSGRGYHAVYEGDGYNAPSTGRG